MKRALIAVSISWFPLFVSPSHHASFPALLVLLAIPVGWALGYGLSWLIILATDTELMRLPLVVSGRTLARAAIIVVIAALLSGLLVVRRLRRLDLVEVLKTRE